MKSLNYSTFSLNVLNDEQNESKHKKRVIVKSHLEIIPKAILWLYSVDLVSLRGVSHMYF